jgi:hypothetical protein
MIMTSNSGRGTANGVRAEHTPCLHAAICCAASLGTPGQGDTGYGFPQQAVKTQRGRIEGMNHEGPGTAWGVSAGLLVPAHRHNNRQQTRSALQPQHPTHVH